MSDTSFNRPAFGLLSSGAIKRLADQVLLDHGAGPIKIELADGATCRSLAQELAGRGLRVVQKPFRFMLRIDRYSAEWKKAA